MFFLLNRPQGSTLTILVPSPSASVVPGAVPTREESRININTASMELLMTLPNIAGVRAKAIVDYRREHGPFRRTDELMKVPDIGPVTYQRIRDLVTVEDVP